MCVIIGISGPQLVNWSVAETIAIDKNMSTLFHCTLRSCSLRPDCCVWHQHSVALLLRARRSPWVVSMALADRYWEEDVLVVEPLQGPLVMGSLPFLMCYASCSPYLQFFVIMRNPVAVSELLNLGQLSFPKLGRLFHYLLDIL